jgi:hypothetical protein
VFKNGYLPEDNVMMEKFIIGKFSFLALVLNFGFTAKIMPFIK